MNLQEDFFYEYLNGIENYEKSFSREKKKHL